MWSVEKPFSGITNRVVVPTDGFINVVKPEGVEVLAYINSMPVPVHHVHVKAGDTVHFELKSNTDVPTSVSLEYAGNTDLIEVDASKKTKEDDMTGSEAINLFANPMRGDNMGGALGGGLGAGLVGGILGTALLGRNGLNGNLDGAGALAATLRNPPEQDMANMSLMAAIGGVDKAVAVSTAAMEASQANQTIGINAALNSVTQGLSLRLDTVKDAVNTNAVALMQGQNALSQTVMSGNSLINQNIMENRYELSKDISNDGEKTRALITQQYEINLQRQLADANAAIIELRSRDYAGSAARGVEVTTTNNINQMQQQQQQQQQFGHLAHLIYALGQNITNGNAAINVGSGTQTSTPTNTNTNIR